MSGKKSWFRSEVSSTDASVVDIHIDDFIGGWVEDWWNRNFGYELALTSKAFVEALDALSSDVKTIRVYINTPGGDTFAALVIANALRNQQQVKGRVVETYCVGLAASAGSIILMAGSKVTVADNALVMIHNPWTVAIGNTADLTKVIDELNKVRDRIVATYQWHSTLSTEEIVTLLDGKDGEGTWFSADEAIASGFATDKVEGLKAAASIDPRGLKAMKIPDQFKAKVEALVAPPAAEPKALAASDVLRLCREGDVLDLAEGLLNSNATLDQVTSAVSAKKAERTAAATREREIRALCTSAKRDDLANSYVSGGMTVAGVQAQLTIITAVLDQAAINTGLSPDHGSKTKVRIDTQAVYAQLNGQKAKE